jgi:hypothetical protein
MSATTWDGYAVDLVSPIKYVATAMETARIDGAPVSLATMAAAYRHPNTSDLARLRRHHDLATNEAAVEFLLRQAIAALDGRVELVDGGYRLAEPLDDMRYPDGVGADGKRITPYVAPVPVRSDGSTRFHGAFDPLVDGPFAINIRKANARDVPVRRARVVDDQDRRGAGRQHEADQQRPSGV